MSVSSERLSYRTGVCVFEARPHGVRPWTHLEKDQGSGHSGMGGPRTLARKFIREKVKARINAPQGGVY